MQSSGVGVVVPGCSTSRSIPLTVNGTRGVGIGGLVETGPVLGPGRISLEAMPWTIGTATLLTATPGGGVASVTRRGFVHGQFSETSTWGPAFDVPSNRLQIIVPTQIHTDLPGLEKVALFGTLNLLPEPRRGLALLTGAAALAALGWRRARR